MVKRKRVEGNFKLSKGRTAQQNGTKLTTSDEDSKETDIEREKEENESKNTTKQQFSTQEIKPMRPKQLPMMDGNTDKLVEIESENNKDEQ